MSDRARIDEIRAEIARLMPDAMDVGPMHSNWDRIFDLRAELKQLGGWEE